MMSITKMLSISALLAGLVLQPAHAEILYSNFGNGAGYGYSIGDAVVLAQGFTATSTDPNMFQNITLSFGLDGGRDVTNGSFSVTLNSDLNGSPDAIIQTLGIVYDTDLSTTSYTQFVFTAAYGTFLTPGQYWIEVADLGTDGTATDGVWQTAVDESGGGSIRADGQSIYSMGTGAGLVAEIGGVPLVMQVEAPEPMTLAVLGVGLAGIGYARRRRARTV